MEDAEIDAAARLFFEVGTLKMLPRTGWFQCGVQRPESIAEHSFRTAYIAMVLAGLEGADPVRAAGLALVHDTQESRVGDIPHLWRKYLTAASNEAVTADQMNGLPAEVAEVFTGLVRDYEHDGSLEVLVAHEADKLECLIQAVEYRDSGHRNVESFITTMRQRLTTKSAQRIADAAVAMSSQAWLAHASTQAADA